MFDEETEALAKELGQKIALPYVAATILLDGADIGVRGVGPSKAAAFTAR